MMKIEFKVNGKTVRLDSPPQKRLLDILRDDLDLIAVKEGCGKGECGSCTVIFNGRRVNSCLVPALQLRGSSVYTLEGVQKWPVFQSIEQVFVEHGAVQCGFCTPGLIMTAYSLLKDNPAPDKSVIRRAVSGNSGLAF